MPWQRHHFKQLESTNSTAADLIRDLWNKSQSPDHHAITADTQSSGRGQHGRTWQSPVGGLYLSAIFENIPANLRDKLALLAGVAVCRALAQLQIPNIGLRWPNDITLRGEPNTPDKKLGGILCESLAQGRQFAAIIGIGLNVNSTLTDLPEPLRPLSTTLLAHTSKSHDLPALTQSLLTSLDQTLHQAATDSFAPILLAARNFDSLQGKSIQLQSDNTTHTGTAAGLSDEGHLLLRTPTQLLQFPRATITHINNIPIRQNPRPQPPAKTL